MRVVVVEDEDAAREVIVDSLQFAGIEAVGAQDGADAIAKLEHAGEAPSAILLDLMMPRMNGWEFRDWQRRHPRFASIPVVLLSAVRDLAARAKELGTTGSLEKPLHFDALLATVQRFVPPAA